LKEYTEVVDPSKLTPEEEVLEAFQTALDHRSDALRELWLKVADRNFDAIDSCQMLVAVLDGDPPDIGTVSEVAWAAAHGLTVLDHRSDLRQSGEEGVATNLMVPGAIRRSGGRIESRLFDLENAVEATAARLAAEATAEVRPGVYEHYKGGRYRAAGIGEDTESGIRKVVYRSLPDDGKIHLRSPVMFTETVETPGGGVPRFRFLSATEELDTGKS